MVDFVSSQTLHTQVKENILLLKSADFYFGSKTQESLLWGFKLKLKDLLKTEVFLEADSSLSLACSLCLHSIFFWPKSADRVLKGVGTKRRCGKRDERKGKKNAACKFCCSVQRADYTDNNTQSIGMLNAASSLWTAACCCIHSPHIQNWKKKMLALRKKCYMDTSLDLSPVKANCQTWTQRNHTGLIFLFSLFTMIFTMAENQYGLDSL